MQCASRAASIIRVSLRNPPAAYGVNRESLANFSFAEKSPFTAAAVTISNLTYIEEEFSEFLFGALLSLEYRLTQRLSAVLDFRMIYANPKNTARGQRINLLHFQPVLGIQYSF